MVSPVITIFKTVNSSKLVDLFESLGYAPYINYTADYGWLKKELVGAYHCYSIYNDCVYSYKVDDIDPLEYVTPAFAFSFSSDINWRSLNAWLNHIILNIKTNYDISWLDKAIVQKVSNVSGDLKLFEIDGFGVGSVEHIPPTPLDTFGTYEFKKFYFEAIDTMFYEVVRPGTVVPFTVVVVSFSLKGHEYFFTDIYASNAWDYNRRECLYDFNFLKALWSNFFKLPGEFNMELVKARIDRCTPEKLSEGVAPEAEPLVYRRAMDVVISAYKERSSVVEIKPDYMKNCL